MLHTNKYVHAPKLKYIVMWVACCMLKKACLRAMCPAAAVWLQEWTVYIHQCMLTWYSTLEYSGFCLQFPLVRDSTEHVTALSARNCIPLSSCRCCEPSSPLAFLASSSPSAVLVLYNLTQWTTKHIATATESKQKKRTSAQMQIATMKRAVVSFISDSVNA